MAPPPPIFPLTTAWVSSLEGPESADVGFIESSLASDGSRVIATTRSGFVFGLDIATGALAWRVGGRPGQVVSDVDTAVVKQEDGVVWRMDSATGSARWKSATEIAGAVPPFIDGTRVFVAGKGLAALDLNDGEIVWARREGPAVTSPFVVERAFLLFGREDGAVECARKNTGRTVWTHPTGARVVAPPVVDDAGRVLIGTTSGWFEALDLRSGRRRWRWRIGADVHASAVVWGDSVLFATLENVLYSLDRGNGHLRWRTPLPSRPLAAPQLVGRTVLLACSDNEIVGIDPLTGKIVGNLALRLGENATPVVRTAPLRIGPRLFLGLANPVAVVGLDLPPGVSP